MSFLVLQSLDGGERADCSTLPVFLMPGDCWRSVALLHGASDLSAVCDCGISGRACLS